MILLAPIFLKVSLNSKKIDQHIQQDFEKNLPTLIHAWKKKSPLFLYELVTYFQCDFKLKKYNALIFLGTTIGYGSKRLLLLGIRAFIDSTLWQKSVSREDAFIDFVFHELLHKWIDENFNKNKSLILKRYKNENIHVQTHIHLIAIQKMIYLKLKRFDLLNMIETQYSKSGEPYKRAWQIVNDAEDYQSIIDDLSKNLN